MSSSNGEEYFQELQQQMRRSWLIEQSTRVRSSVLFGVVSLANLYEAAFANALNDGRFELEDGDYVIGYRAWDAKQIEHIELLQTVANLRVEHATMQWEYERHCRENDQPILLH